MEEDDWLLELGKIEISTFWLWRAHSHVDGFFPVLHVLSFPPSLCCLCIYMQHHYFMACRRNGWLHNMPARCLGFEPESVNGTRLDICNLGKLILTSMCYRQKDVLPPPSFQMFMGCRGEYLGVRQCSLIMFFGKSA
jgi:hypothetical protein